MSDDGSESDTFITQAGATVATGALASCACQDITQNPAAASFNSGLRSWPDFAPGIYSGEAYDATNAVISVMKKIGCQRDEGQGGERAAQRQLQGADQDRRLPVRTGTSAGPSVYIYKVEGAHFVQLGSVAQLVGS